MNNLVRGCLLAILTLGAFWRVFACDFVVYDDLMYVTDNVFVRQGLSGKNVWWALTTFEASNWHPLMWLSLMLDRDLYGLNPGGFHATNLAWHLVNTLLLFHLLTRMAPAWPWRSFLVALLFAVHPLHVESVAWVSERKDLLFTAFGLLALHAYVSYSRGSRRAYWWSVLFLLLSLMSKSMLLTFPFLLLLLDYWPLCRVARKGTDPSEVNFIPSAESTLEGSPEPPETQPPAPARVISRTWPQLVLEKWPMFVVIFGVSITALLAQSKGGSVTSLQFITLPIRMANAALAYGLYLWDTVWPTGLSVIYRHPREQISLAEAGVAFVILLALSVVLFRFRQRLPTAWVGWCWFVGTLVPVIGVVQVGLQQRADRYTYFSLIGLFWGVVWTASERQARSGRWQTVVFTATTLMMASLLIVCQAQVGHWKNSDTLFEHALQVEPQNAIAYHNLGFARQRQGDLETATAHYRQAVKCDPALASAQVPLAHVLLETAKGPNKDDQRKEAVAIIKKILQADPKHALANNLRGKALRDAGRLEEALKSFQIACEGRPYSVSIRSNLAQTLYELGRRDEAQRQFDQARRLDPENPTLLLNLGVVEFQAGHVRQAIELFEQAGRSAQESSRAKRFQASARLTLGALAMQQGKFSEAVREFERSEELEPEVWQLQVNFGEALLQLNQLKPAENRFLKALELDPQCVEAHYGIGRVYANTQQLEPAIEHLNTALKLRPGFQPAQEFLNSLNSSEK